MSLEAAAPSGPAVRLAEDEEARCEAYSRGRLQLSVAEFLVLLLVLASLTLSGAAGALLHLCGLWAASRGLADLTYLLLVGSITRLTVFPFHFLSEYWLDHRFGLSRQTPAGWAWEWLARSAVFGLATVAVLFPVAETLRWPILVALWSLAYLPCRSLFYDYVYSPLMALFYPVRFLRNETFYVPGSGDITLPVYQVAVGHKTSRANASIRIRGRKTAIYVTDTLIDQFTDGEERVVMAHEFGHLYDQVHLETRTRAGIAQAQRKVMYGSAQLLAGAAGLLLLALLAPRLGLHGVADLAGFPLLAAMTIAFAHCLAPILCAEARRDERDADEYALAVTGDVDNYLSVMRKLRRMNLEESSPHPLSRLLFDTHPSYTERCHVALQHRRRIQRRPKKHHHRGRRHIQHHGRR